MESNDPAQLRLLIPELPRTLKETARSLADAWEQGLKHRETLSLAYARLFLGPFQILASPYASFYLQSDQQLMGPVSQFVAGVYADAGLTPGPGPREAPDHVSLEWEYLYFLTHQFLATGEGQWLEKRNDFVSTHMMQWIPSLADAISRAMEHDFYDALSMLLMKVFKDPVFL